eukprot:m.48740 g.48740  ORF g.48740 m.48740 type:complete len:146 (-) comp20843_c0_seq1:611-1048(-)
MASIANQLTFPGNPAGGDIPASRKKGKMVFPSLETFEEGLKLKGFPDWFDKPDVLPKLCTLFENDVYPTMIDDTTNRQPTPVSIVLYPRGAKVFRVGTATRARLESHMLDYVRLMGPVMYGNMDDDQLCTALHQAVTQEPTSTGA